MKFLFWQFSAYASAALLVGVVVGRMLAGPVIARARREADAANLRAEALLRSAPEAELVVRRNEMLSASVVRLEAELQSSRDALLLAETDLHVAVLAGKQAREALASADSRRSAAATQAARAHVAEGELAAAESELAAFRGEASDAHESANRRIADAEGRTRIASERLESLRVTHAELVRRSQTALTHAEIRAEQAEATASMLGASLARERAAFETAVATRAGVGGDAETVTEQESPDVALLILHDSWSDVGPDAGSEGSDGAASSGNRGGDERDELSDDLGLHRGGVTIDLASARSARSARHSHPAVFE